MKLELTFARGIKCIVRDKMYCYENAYALKTFKKEVSLCLSEDEFENKSKFSVCGVEFVYLYVIGIATAFVGWIAENTVKLISSGRIDCRFHILPFISPYAMVPIALHAMVGDPDDLSLFGVRIFKEKTAKSKVLSNIFTYSLICFAVFAGEFIIGNLWELLFGVKLWNYSNQPLHLTQYVSLFSTLGYGTGAYVLYKYAMRPAIHALKSKGDYGVARAVCSTLGLWIVVDTFFMCLQIVLFRQAPMYWSISF